MRITVIDVIGAKEIFVGGQSKNLPYYCHAYSIFVYI